MAPAGGGVKGFYRQAKKRGGVAKPSSSKRSKNKPPQQCTTKDEGRGEDQVAAEVEELSRFDMDMKYGPCISVTRLRRWERAAAMGLRPPPHIQYLVLRRGDPAGWSPSRSPATKNSAATDSHPSSSASLTLTSLQLQCIWEGKI